MPPGPGADRSAPHEALNLVTKLRDLGFRITEPGGPIVTMPANLRPARGRDDLPYVARLLTLSDNVVAIVLTLLVFQLKVPATALVADQDSAADQARQ